MSDQENSKLHPGTILAFVAGTATVHLLQKWLSAAATGAAPNATLAAPGGLDFAQVMMSLRSSSPQGQHDSDVVIDFIANKSAHGGLRYPTEREEFRRSVSGFARTVDEAVSFLQLLAALPDHTSRRAFLESIGYLGNQRVDPAQWLQEQLAAVGRAPRRVLNLLDEQIARLDATVTKLPSAQPGYVSPGVMAFRRAKERWKNRW